MSSPQRPARASGRIRFGLATFVAGILIIFSAMAGGLPGIPLVPVSAADQCVALGGTLASGECQISSAQVKTGSFTLDETLHFLAGGSITVAPGSSLTLTITGSLTMDSGTSISSLANQSEVGATITINATGKVNLQGTAQINSDNAGQCNGGSGGNIIITSTYASSSSADPAIYVGASAKITSNGGVGGQRDALVETSPCRHQTVPLPLTASCSRRLCRGRPVTVAIKTVAPSGLLPAAT